MTDAILTINTGSSSLKFRLFELTPDLPYRLGGKISGIGGRPTFQVHRQEQSRDESIDLPLTLGIDSAVAFALDWLGRESGRLLIKVAAHRIVNGGPHDQALELSPQTVEDLRAYIPLAPQHQPHNLAAVEALWASHPRLRQYGCFDTAFHARLGPLAAQFALPDSITSRGIRRYGYHGLSYAWTAERLRQDFPALAGKAVVVAHLGNGASLCAMRDGKSIDTTMGLTALDGLPMGTRCGALDPGVVLHMQRSLGLSLDAVERLLYEESGLKGLSGISNDVKTLLASSDPRARFALDYFAHKAAQAIGAMAVSLGALDAIVFTGGIGENAETVRQAILDKLRFLFPFEVHVIAANEERAMAIDVLRRLDLQVAE